MATTTRGAPIGTASVPGRNGNGVASWITAPETSEVRYTSGGRMRPRFATSCAALGGPQLCGLVVMVFGPANRPIDRAEGEVGGRQLQRPGWAAADSFGDNNPVTFGIRDHALVVSIAGPSWPIEKREPVALQSLCKGVDGGPRAQLHTQVSVPDELARAL